MDQTEKEAIMIASFHRPVRVAAVKIGYAPPFFHWPQPPPRLSNNYQNGDNNNDGAQRNSQEDSSDAGSGYGSGYSNASTAIVGDRDTSTPNSGERDLSTPNSQEVLAAVASSPGDSNDAQMSSVGSELSVSFSSIGSQDTKPKDDFVLSQPNSVTVTCGAPLTTSPLKTPSPLGFSNPLVVFDADADDERVIEKKYEDYYNIASYKGAFDEPPDGQDILKLRSLAFPPVGGCDVLVISESSNEGSLDLKLTRMVHDEILVPESDSDELVNISSDDLLLANVSSDDSIKENVEDYLGPNEEKKEDAFAPLRQPTLDFARAMQDLPGPSGLCRFEETNLHTAIVTSGSEWNSSPPSMKCMGYSNVHQLKRQRPRQKIEAGGPGRDKGGENRTVFVQRGKRKRCSASARKFVRTSGKMCRFKGLNFIKSTKQKQVGHSNRVRVKKNCKFVRRVTTTSYTKIVCREEILNGEKIVDSVSTEKEEKPVVVVVNEELEYDEFVKKFAKFGDDPEEKKTETNAATVNMQSCVINAKNLVMVHCLTFSDIPSTFKDIAIGKRVMSRWKDGFFYPGIVIGKNESDKWIVKYDDGSVRPAMTSIFAIDILPAKLEIFAQLNPGLDFQMGTILSQEIGGLELNYLVEFKSGDIKMVPHSAIALSIDQSSVFKAADNLIEPGITLDNIIEGKRRHNLSTGKHESKQDGTESDRKIAQSSKSWKCKRSNSKEMSSDKPKAQKSLVFCSIKAMHVSKMEEESPTLIVSDQGPIPPEGHGLFKGKIFLITQGPIRINNDVPELCKVHLKSQILAGGGVVMDDFLEDEKQMKTNFSQYFLISDSHCRTSKYILALSLSIPCVSHFWIINCCKQEKLLDPTDYMLPAGFSYITDDVIEWHGKRKIFGGLSFGVAFDANSDCVQLVTKVLILSGGQVVTDKNSVEIYLIVADDALPIPDKQNLMLFKKIIVTKEWVFHCLIHGYKLQFTAHEKFSLNVTLPRFCQLAKKIKQMKKYLSPPIWKRNRSYSDSGLYDKQPEHPNTFVTVSEHNLDVLREKQELYPAPRCRLQIRIEEDTSTEDNDDTAPNCSFSKLARVRSAVTSYSASSLHCHGPIRGSDQFIHTPNSKDMKSKVKNAKFCLCIVSGDLILIPVNKVLKITKEKTARIIPNAVGVETEDNKHVFGSLLSRETTFQLMFKVWAKYANTDLACIRDDSETENHSPDIEPEIIEDDEDDEDSDDQAPSGTSSEGPSCDSVPDRSCPPSPSNISIDTTSNKTKDSVGTTPLKEDLRLLKDLTTPIVRSCFQKVYEIVPVDRVPGSARDLASKLYKLPRSTFLLLIATIGFLFLSAAVLINRLNSLHYKISSYNSWNGDEKTDLKSHIFQEVFKWQHELHDNCINDVQDTLTLRIQQLIEVRRSLQTLLLLLLPENLPRNSKKASSADEKISNTVV
uniref:BRCT domain-containing protein n=1 Tax=Strigamia maritima TaxID=126957 RepID=T1IJX4_STRMM